MERLLELDDISLYPSPVNAGDQFLRNFNYAVFEENESFLPIFVKPIKSLVGKDNFGIYQKNGLRPIIPVTEDIQFRLESCCHIYTAFTLREIKQNFLENSRKHINFQFKIYFDHPNGHDQEVLNLGMKLKEVYGQQVLLIGGPIANPKTYLEYCRAGFDYVRVGINLESECNIFKFEIKYPIVSLLLDIQQTLKAAVGLKQTKIIVDGGIYNYNDILKCISLGAEYVIIGKEFSRILEAAGPISTKSDNTIDITTKITKEDLESGRLIREYVPNNWIKVNITLDNWLKGMYECFQEAFIMMSSQNWTDFKKSSNFVIIE